MADFRLSLWQEIGICFKRGCKTFGEIEIDIYTEEKILRISVSTIDRLLTDERNKYELKGRSHTKPGALLKNHISIRTFSQWDEQESGFLEIRA